MTTARLELRGVHKSFGSVTALEPLDLALPAATIHGILGENGAGKSTLVGIIAGNVVPDDAGTIRVEGRTLPPGPRAAHDAGIGIVHQHFALIGPLSVAENLRLGRPEAASRMLSPAELISEAKASAAEHHLDIGDPAARCDTLPVGTQARIEILRALRDAPKILLLDEPTAVLTPDETAQLFTTLRRLRDAGVLVVLITHKLGEALRVCDTITVLRRGAVVATLSARETSATELAYLMVGDRAGGRGVEDASSRGDASHPNARLDIPHSSAALPVERQETASSASPSHDANTARRTPLSDGVLAVQGLSTSDDGVRVPLRDVGFAVADGEICGVAGVDGNGQEELAGALYGLVRRDGVVAVRGRRVPGGDVVAAQLAGMALIPPDRRREGLALGLTVWENALLAAPLLERFTRSGVLDRTAAREFATELAREYRVGRGDPDEATAALSGGNQQRLVIGRAMALDPVVLIAVNPTRGLDIAATGYVHAVLRDAARRGMAILLISTDLDELGALCRRTFVLYRGRLLGPIEVTDRARIGAVMGGAAA